MTIIDKAAPMAAAPMKYLPDGQVDWGNMWDSFCALPRDGGPAHRPSMLEPELQADPADPQYRAVVAEICRGIKEVSGCAAEAAESGWIAVQCPKPGMATWLAEAIVQEGVHARSSGDTLYVPAGANYTVQGEIKSVITVVAKTTHYWAEHVPLDVKRALAMQERFKRIWGMLRGNR